jgi:hypothetical protein
MELNMDKALLYRAMCKEEFESTIKEGSAVFYKRFKWFTPNKEFLMNRVRDGKFNNSHIERNRYDYIVCFEADMTKARILNNNEVQFDRRRNPTIKLKRVVKS